MNIDSLNAEIARNRLSIPTLAVMMGINKKTLYSRMRGDTAFSREEIIVISNILQLSDNQILEIFFCR